VPFCRRNRARGICSVVAAAAFAPVALVVDKNAELRSNRWATEEDDPTRPREEDNSMDAMVERCG